MSVFTRIFALCATILPFVSTAQQSKPLPKTLLWRISGHGLQKPSYLFGTIHLTDKGLFNFGDSLYAAIEHTEGLAIEVNPDEMIAYVINQAIDSKESRLLKDDLTEEEFRHYGPSLSKRLHKNADAITSKDIVREKNRWLSDFLAKGEMPTFVDAYLYNIAKRQGKWVGGVEDLADQTGLINTLFDKSDLDQIAGDSTPHFTVDKLLKLYVDQDISGIAASMAGFDSTKRDLLLTRRNIKMARRMDSLLAIRSTFFAVGAAHLPGDDGVITLLRKRGFAVEPVFSSRKLPADQYKYQSVPLAWEAVTYADSMYTISMPGHPVDAKLYGLLDMKFMFDISDMTGFCTMAFPGSNKSRNIDTVGALMSENMFGKHGKVVTRYVTSGGLKGIEFTGRKDDFRARVQVFTRDNFLYVAFVIARKPEMLQSADADKFFASLRTRPPFTKKQKAETVTDTRFAVSLTTPGHMALSKKGQTGNGWDYVTYIGVDTTRDLATVLSCKATDGGHYITSDSIVLEDMNNMLDHQHPVTQKTQTVDGRPAYELEGRDADGNVLRILSVVRGNKHIAVCIVANDSTAHIGAADSIFSSLRLLPYKEMVWSPTTILDSGYRTWAPQAFEHVDNNEEGMQYTFDSLSATSYYIEADTLYDYAWSASDTAYCNDRIRQYAEENAIVSLKPIRQGPYPGSEAWVRRPSPGQYSRVRAVRFGKVVCIVMATGEKDVLEGANASRLFTELSPVSHPAPFDLSASKSKQLIRNLGSADSATRDEASSALGNVLFSKADISLWQEALYERYAPMSGDSLYMNRQIGEVIAAVADPSTLRYINSHSAVAAAYPGVTVNVLAGMKTPASYEALAQFLALHPAAMDYRALTLMKDSLALLGTIMPRLLSLSADTNLASYMADMAVTLSDSGLLSTPSLMAYQPQFISAVRQVAPARIRSDYNSYPYYSLPRIMGTFNTPASLDALALLAAAKDKYLRLHVATELVRQGRKVDTAILNSLAADPTLRYQFYSDLQAAGKASSYPRTYYGQRYFAESAMYGAASDDDEDPSRIKQVGERVSDVNGTRYRFYLYKVTYADDPARTYLGVAGGYDVAGKDVDPKLGLIGMYREPYDKAKVDQYFAAFLKQQEGEEESE